jgi:uncharacterized protein (DUF983 family)
VDVCFSCPSCDRPARTGVRAPLDWQCPACEHRQHLDAADPALPHCVICGNPELYKKKDFPHWLGMTILVVACVASAFTYLWYEKWLTWAILIGSALIDGALYLAVGDAVVCYRCGAHHKGFTPTGDHRPFELTIGERYRQERLRAEQLKGGTGNPSRPSGPV